jgi:SAM-dependent methyltransferase
LPDNIADHVVCPRCSGPVKVRDAEVACEKCRQEFPRVGAVPVLMNRPDAVLSLWGQQLNLITSQVPQTKAGLQAQAHADGITPPGTLRLEALAQGVLDQATDVVALMAPALPGAPGESNGASLPPAMRTPLKYVHYLYRDWAWEQSGHTENRDTLAAVKKVTAGAALGRVLVLGAGGCRLAYDLHQACGATETAAVDIDPFLFVFAQAVIRGGQPRLTESTANVQEAAKVAHSWTLRAPAGPLDDKTFHFFLANGLEPPFDDGLFDTVVTPWFIDQVPPDLPPFLARIARALKPGGRWINLGPLLYPPETQMSRRYSREEVFCLAQTAGFHVDDWIGESKPYLVTPLNGRGKVEWVMTFSATYKRH